MAAALQNPAKLSQLHLSMKELDTACITYGVINPEPSASITNENLDNAQNRVKEICQKTFSSCGPYFLDRFTAMEKIIGKTPTHPEDKYESTYPSLSCSMTVTLREKDSLDSSKRGEALEQEMERVEAKLHTIRDAFYNACREESVKSSSDIRSVTAMVIDREMAQRFKRRPGEDTPLLNQWIAQSSAELDFNQLNGILCEMDGVLANQSK